MVANRPFHGLVSSRDQTLALYTEISVWFRILSEQPIKNIQEFRSDGAWKVSFYALLMSASKVAKVAGTTSQTRGLQTEWSFSMMHDFWQSSEALRLSQVSKMLLQISGQISAHCSSHLCLSRPDRDRDEKYGRKRSAFDDSDRGAIAPIAPRTSAKNAKRLTTAITAILPRNSAKNAKQSTTAIAERSLPSCR